MITVRIEKESYGSFIARNEGKIIFTDGVLPGELCRLRITEEKKDFAFAELVEVIEPSDKRIKPACPNFMKCGGCDYLHTDYRTELEFKKNIIKDSIRRIGRFDFNSEITTYASERYGYRSRCSVKSNGNQTGFYGKKSNTVIPFPEQGCILLDDAINRFIQNNRITQDCRISRDSKGCITNTYSAEIIEKELDFTYYHNSESFFQSNGFLRPKMLELVIEQSAGFSQAIDMGCGCGFFTIPLSKKMKITGIDISKESIASAKKNNIENRTDAKFIRCDMDSIPDSIKTADLIVTDPPRAGMNSKAREIIKKISPEKIIYVSCNPSTWARDAGDLIKSGFKLESVDLIDMFPGTMHIELISSFSFDK
ncbi:MAG TPA: methyltransferase domain-containing protein [Spirochaetota bacterium]|nr:class I SAM-dependent RNA methyltransferase [Spirochaetota bacterium]HOA07139.1 methyltransferase domain-containing protein [Spirochaetota bacterium]HOH36660.1 methyltransferase domain-containing protein [Spirochaetota bacterium]HPJ15080.1 methyltransferase domain-containing protein [Spirochaetota bacterium]HPM35176.1 methyltransferase domain-containing protein [Spirochaetota bacterium]